MSDTAEYTKTNTKVKEETQMKQSDTPLDEEKKLQTLLEHSSGIMYLPNAEALAGSLSGANQDCLDILDGLGLQAPINGKNPKAEHRTHCGTYIILDAEQMKQVVANSNEKDPVEILRKTPKLIVSKQLYAGDAPSDISSRCNSGCTFKDSAPKNGSWPHPMQEFWYSEDKVIEYTDKNGVDQKLDYNHIKGKQQISVFLIGTPENEICEDGKTTQKRSPDVPSKLHSKIEKALFALCKVSSDHGFKHACESISSKGNFVSPKTLFANFKDDIKNRNLSPMDEVSFYDDCCLEMITIQMQILALNSDRIDENSLKNFNTAQEKISKVVDCKKMLQTGRGS